MTLVGTLWSSASGEFFLINSEKTVTCTIDLWHTHIGKHSNASFYPFGNTLIYLGKFHWKPFTPCLVIFTDVNWSCILILGSLMLQHNHLGSCWIELGNTALWYFQVWLLQLSQFNIELMVVRCCTFYTLCHVCLLP